MPMLKKTLKPGSRIVSHDFDMGDWKPTQELTMKVTGDRDHTIYLWVIPIPTRKSLPRRTSQRKRLPRRTSQRRPISRLYPKCRSEERAPKKDEPKKEPFETINVPYVPTPQAVVEEMLELAKVKEGDVVYDLGCGDGRIVMTAVKKFKAKKGYGVDLNPERIKDSLENAKKARHSRQSGVQTGRRAASCRCLSSQCRDSLSAARSEPSTQADA